MNQIKVYLYSENPLDSADGKWDFGLLKEIFDKYKLEPSTVKDIPDTDRAFVVIPGQGNAGKEKIINEKLIKVKRLVLIITGDESAMFDADAIKHPNVSIWVQYPHQKHEKYNRFFVGVPQHLKNNLPNYPSKDYDVYFGGQITHQRRRQLAEVMPSLENALYRPTEGFAQGDVPQEYYQKLSSAKIAPCPSGAQVIDTFRFFEAIEMLCLPIGDLIDSRGKEKDYFAYVDSNNVPVPKVYNWNAIKDMLPELISNYPANMHQVVCWWIKYKRDLGKKLMEQVNE